GAGREDVDEANAPTMLAGMDQHARELFERTAAGGAAVSRPQSEDDAGQDGEGPVQDPQANGAPMRATGTWLFTDTDFSSMTPVKGPGAGKSDATQQVKTELVTQIAAQPPIDTSSTSRLTALDPDGLDLDLSSLDSLKDSDSSDGVDLDVGAAPTNGTTHARTLRLESIAPEPSEALPDLEPVTLSEVGTKLDLARAYMDMGDPDGARSILSEVLSEGSLSQKQEARRLIDALPG
ncbi:MAG: FimV/HubP family polar landmark protein, partial [Steroidobacteraceae bacterium]